MKIRFHWWSKVGPEEQRLFIRHLKIKCALGYYPTTTLHFIGLCIQILEAMVGGLGETEPSMDLVCAAEQRGYRRGNIEPTIEEAWQDYQSPRSTTAAAKCFGLSARHTRTILAQIGKINGDVVKVKGKWQVPVSALDEWLLQHGKVKI